MRSDKLSLMIMRSDNETFGAGKPPASHSNMTVSPSAAVWLSGSLKNKIKLNISKL